MTWGAGGQLDGGKKLGKEVESRVNRSGRSQNPPSGRAKREGWYAQWQGKSRSETRGRRGLCNVNL